MTRALKILGLLLAACLCQTNLSPYVRLGSIAPDFMIAALTALSGWIGPYGGFCAGAVLGLLYDSTVGYVLALNIILYTFIGYAAPVARQMLNARLSKWKHKSRLILLAIGFGLTLVREAADIGYLFLIGAEQGLVTLLRMLACAAYTALLTLPVSYAADRLFRTAPVRPRPEE